MFTNEAELFRGYGALNALVMSARWRSLLSRLEAAPEKDIEARLRAIGLKLHKEIVSQNRSEE